MNNNVSDLNYIVSIEKGSKTDLALTRYLATYEEKRPLYVIINECPSVKLVLIRTAKEYTFFVCRIFQQESSSAIDDNSDLLRKRFRWIDKKSSIGAIEVQLLQKALNSDSGEDIKTLYEIQENEYFILIETKIIGDSDILYEILLFSKLPVEDRKRLIQRKCIKKKHKEYSKKVPER